MMHGHHHGHSHGHHHGHHHHGHEHAPGGMRRYYSGNPVAMRRTAWATVISFLMMLAEITAGHLTGSMALLADGWHMATHVLALGLSWLAFRMSSRLADDPRFAFGSGKIETLASFVSALLLLGIGGWMALESIARLLAPTDVKFMDAMVVAVIGLWVNLICALLLQQKSAKPVHLDANGQVQSVDGRGAESPPATVIKPAAAENLNLKAAYVHVLADALTSILAIVALLFGQMTGMPQIDSFVGLVGALMVVVWARSLLMQAGWLLLDRQADPRMLESVRSVAEQQAPGAELIEMKLWHVSDAGFACNLILQGQGTMPQGLRATLEADSRITHLVIEWRERPSTGQSATIEPSSSNPDERQS